MIKNLATLTLFLFAIFFAKRFLTTKAGHPKTVEKPKVIKREVIENKVEIRKTEKKVLQVSDLNKEVIPKNKKTNTNKIINKPGFVPMDKSGNLIIRSIALDGEKAIVYGDVLIGSKDDIMDTNRQGKPILMLRPKLWSKGIVYYEIESSLPNYEEVKKSINYFNELGIVKFVESHSDNYIYFRSGDNNCYSYVGMIGGEQEVSLSAGCSFREINHELMHALGFLHEQSREDRDDYLKIIWDQIKQEYHPQFDKVLNSFTNISDTTFDFNSIMLYPPTAFAKDPGTNSMAKKDGSVYKVSGDGFLSKSDIKRLKNLYSKEILQRD